MGRGRGRAVDLSRGSAARVVRYGQSLSPTVICLVCYLHTTLKWKVYAYKHHSHSALKPHTILYAHYCTNTVLHEIKPVCLISCKGIIQNTYAHTYTLPICICVCVSECVGASHSVQQFL